MSENSNINRDLVAKETSGVKEPMRDVTKKKDSEHSQSHAKDHHENAGKRSDLPGEHKDEKAGKDHDKKFPNPSDVNKTAGNADHKVTNNDAQKSDWKKDENATSNRSKDSDHKSK